jgi:hypothetical protein
VGFVPDYGERKDPCAVTVRLPRWNLESGRGNRNFAKDEGDAAVEARLLGGRFFRDRFSLPSHGAGRDFGGESRGAKQITNVYLAAMALRNGGRLVIFDSE